MRRLSTLLLAAAMPLGCTDRNDMPAGPDTELAEARTGRMAEATYEVTVSNLTDGQPLTPPVAAIHRQSTELFEVGEAASFEVKEIAENGNVMPLLEALSGNHHVVDHVLAAAAVPPILPGASRSFTLTAERGAKYLSWISMLICTNDGFTGSQSMRLPAELGGTATTFADAYDAGTEINTEDYADMVPPCQALVGPPSGDAGTGMSDPALAEGGVIHHHGGILGGADLDPAIHGWDNPVVMIQVTRIS